MVHRAGGDAEPVVDGPARQVPPPLPVHLPSTHSQGTTTSLCQGRKNEC